MNITRPYKLFLLGGYDLEMLTIKQLLEGVHDCVVIDKQLKWENAHLSEYQDDLRQYANYYIYGIELQEDITPPDNYHRIDHHNDYDYKQSSLEQVAEIVGIGLNRRQQLIAANDRGYIPAMQKLLATEEDIADIRRMDRAAQGITAEDETQAQESVKNNLRTSGSLIIVKSQTACFSAICDLLFPYKRLLIYTDSEWMFYGEGKTELVEALKDSIRESNVFYGGGDHGFIGSKKNAFSKEEIEQFVNYIRQRL